LWLKKQSNKSGYGSDPNLPLVGCGKTESGTPLRFHSLRL